VTFVCDSGNKYLSKVFNDYWLIDQGFLKREQYGDLRDLITRRHDEKRHCDRRPRRQVDDRVCAHEALRYLSVTGARRGPKWFGIVDEWDLLTATQENSERFRDPVRSAMTQRIETVA